MSFTEINRACEAILDRHQSRENSSYLKYRLTPDTKRRLMDQGLIGYKPPPKPMSYEKKTDIKRETNKFTLEQIKTKLAVIEEMRAEGMTILDACKLSGISQGNLHRWQNMVKEAGQ
jgi:hypothetical protein